MLCSSSISMDRADANAFFFKSSWIWSRSFVLRLVRCFLEMSLMPLWVLDLLYFPVPMPSIRKSRLLATAASATAGLAIAEQADWSFVGSRALRRKG